MHDLSVVIPAYLEETTIQICIENLSQLLNQENIKFEIVVVVDGSPDNTLKVVNSLSFDFIKAIENSKNLGKGASLRRGVNCVTGEFVAFFDADLDLDPSNLLQFYRLAREKGLDAVVGSKVHPDSKVNYPLSRKILSNAYRKLISFLFSLSVSDTQTGVKVFKREKLMQVINKTQINGFSFDLELLVLMQQKNFTIKEAPVNLAFNFSSTVSIRAALRALIDTLVIYRKHQLTKI